MSACPNGHNPVTVVYDANGWQRWCGECGAMMREPPVPRRSVVRPAARWAVRALVGGATVISLIGAALLAAVLIVYLLSLLAL